MLPNDQELPSSASPLAVGTKLRHYIVVLRVKLMQFWLVFRLKSIELWISCFRFAKSLSFRSLPANRVRKSSTKNLAFPLLHLKWHGFTKYIYIALISWENGLVYRLNFIMWRVRMVISLLTFYYLWSAVTVSSSEILSYNQSSILTYVIVGWLVGNIVRSSRSIDAQGEIASGDLNNFLVKPLNYFLYWASRDISDKLLNIFFSIFELIAFYFIAKPPLLLPQHLFGWASFIISLALSLILYFFFSFVISMTTFWYYQGGGWAQRFLVFTLIGSLGGTLFPLDMLPKTIYQLINLLPTAYFTYFPTEIYLNRLSTTQFIIGIGTQIFWTITLYLLAKTLWRRGLKVYGAYGR